MRGSGILGVAKRAGYCWVVVVAAVGSATGFAPGASALSKPHVADGSVRINNDYTANKAGGAEITSITYKGALTGTAIDTGTAVVRSNGSFSGHGIELCDPCAIGDKTGAFTATYSYSGSGTTYSGTETFTRGFGKLAGLTGGGSYTGNVNTNVQTYSYSYRP